MATGKPVPGNYEFTYRDATGRQVSQTAKGDTKADAKAERGELLARLHKGERVEWTTLTVTLSAMTAPAHQRQRAQSRRSEADREAPVGRGNRPEAWHQGRKP